MTNQPNSARNVAFILLVLAVLSLLAMQWKQKRTLQRIENENEQLRQQIGVASIPVAEQVPVVPEPAEPPVAVEPVEPVVEMVTTPTGVAAAPRASGMALADIQTMAVEGGIQATVTFSPTDDQPLGVVAVVVRLPLDRDGRILDLALRSSSDLTDTSARISEDGKFAVYHGTVSHVEDLKVVLTVSHPVTADFRGTSGIGPYDLIIEADGAFATQKE